MFDEVKCPLLVFTGEQGPLDPALGQKLGERPNTTVVPLPGYIFQLWSDVIADRTAEIGATILEFLNDIGQQEPLEAIKPDEKEGTIGDITYRIHGAGPPLILLPLTLAPSQWDPLIPVLSKHYCTIALTGTALGIAGFLEKRGRTPGYLNVVRNLVERAKIASREEVLEVGCGTGSLARWLARRTETAKQITAIDINRHLLNEAKRLAKQEQLDDKIQFQEGNAEHIPIPDNTFDMTLCCTVLEEVNADRAMDEIVRVTKPGGRVAIAVRAVDMPRFIHLPLPADLRTRMEAPGAWGGGAAAEGCADATLYRRMQRAGLTGVEKLPQLAMFEGEFAAQELEKNILPLLTPAETAAWRTAMDKAETEGTFFCTYPFHCAIGTKPSVLNRENLQV